MAEEFAHCKEIDELTKKGSIGRIGIIATIILIKVLNKMEEKTINCFLRTSWKFMTHEGIGMAIYFSISFVMDISTIFFFHHDNYCKYQVLVATYSMACLTFLPNCIFASWKQKDWYDDDDDDEGSCKWKIIFILTCVFMTIFFFFYRMMIVFPCHYIDSISWLLSYFNKYVIIIISIFLPIAVDAFQTIILTLVGKKSENTQHHMPLTESP